ncbi:MAG: RNA 3'-terminal phosphate cyclase [Armatimonadetes bacterium]|nr:RNA 3'-terminal phosphate cyclase [Armatimonadota bacterium]
MSSFIQIDGSYGEGGGQILRTSLSLSALTGQPVEFINVRAKRTRPGLQPQHLTAVRAAAALCDARLEGDAVGSTRFTFSPQTPPRPDRYRFDIGTAGATPLVVQTALIPLSLASAGSHLTVTGGTHVPHAPPADYLEAVYLPVLRQAGLHATFRYLNAGFYPKGGGQVEVDLLGGAALQPLDLTERGKLKKLTAYIVTSNLPGHVAERGIVALEKYMKGVGRTVRIERRDLPSPGTGAAVLLAAECENGRGGFLGMGERGKPMERVAEEPCEAFMDWWKTGAAVDEHLADQLVLPMALAAGESRWTAPCITEHLRTVLWATNQFLPIEFILDERPDGTGLVTLKGEGLEQGVGGRV